MPHWMGGLPDDAPPRSEQLNRSSHLRVDVSVPKERDEAGDPAYGTTQFIDDREVARARKDQGVDRREN